MKSRPPAILFLLLCGLASCAKKPALEIPPPPVTYAVAEAEDVPYIIDTFGNCVTIANVTLQAQVEGVLASYAVKEGATVKKGDLIAQIDPAQYQAAVQQTQGSLDSARANLANAQLTYTRQQQLYQTKTGSLADFQTAEAQQLQSQGSVLTAEGELANAQINLAYCTIKSPIDGKCGIYQVDAGNLVTANSTNLMNIQTMDPIYVDFTISENDFDRVRQYFNAGELQVEVNLPADPAHKIPGKLTFINNSVSSGTGTLSLRATFPNAEGVLWPGLFVNVKLILTVLKGAIVVPSQCVMVGQQGTYVFTVAADQTVTQHNVTVSQRQGDTSVLGDGVQAGDKVVTAGQLGLVTGKKITPSLCQPPAPVTERLAAPSPSPAAK